ncbi:hypothetical protein [Streptomyces sp. NPDC102360]|uniref:hypothetical protein n=1 Tax=Streptomyces sp. NPDC102360 TaxID=3366160 RepID=UPI0037F42216
MMKRLKRLGAIPAAGGSAAAGGVGGGLGGSDVGWTVPVWICAVVGAVCAVFLVLIINDIREAVRLYRSGRRRR